MLCECRVRKPVGLSAAKLLCIVCFAIVFFFCPVRLLVPALQKVAYGVCENAGLFALSLTSGSEEPSC